MTPTVASASRRCSDPATHEHGQDARATIAHLFRRLHSDRGDAAVSFILSLPIFLIVVAVIVQFTLILNAKVMLDHATQAAARAAAVALPENPTEDLRRAAILRAAYMALEPLSPMATSPATVEANAVANALTTAGLNPPPSYAARYTYTQDATNVTWTPDNTDYRRTGPTEVKFTLTYQFYLTVPGAKRFIGTNQNIPGGLTTGRVFSMSSTRTFITSPGRQAYGTDNGGS